MAIKGDTRAAPLILEAWMTTQTGHVYNQEASYKEDQIPNLHRVTAENPLIENPGL
jgi:hypothetical protein